MQQLTYIILVNWNGWADTLECLESIFRLREQAFRVIVCDNGSNDDSLSHIQQWAQGSTKSLPTDPKMANYSSPAIEKPIACQVLAREQIEQGSLLADSPLILIDCKENLGFAGGNNIGLRFALAQPDMAWAWLLNNDTVLDRGALDALLEKFKNTPKAGIVGSTLVYYHQPDKVQAFGGARYFPCIGRAMHIGRFRNRLRKVDEQRTQGQMSYVMGASLFVTRKFLETIGLMSEDYFLYYEELDWALRAHGHFTLAYAQDSLVFHKAGASIGSSNKASSRSLLSDQYLMSNRLKITQRFFPRCLIPVYVFMLIEALVRLVRGQSDRASMMWRLVAKRKENLQTPG